jgi:hypothetical protein
MFTSANDFADRRGRRTPSDAAAKRFDHLASPIWIPLGFEECSQYVGGELLLPDRTQGCHEASTTEQARPIQRTWDEDGPHRRRQQRKQREEAPEVGGRACRIEVLCQSLVRFGGKLRLRLAPTWTPLRAE